ARLRQKPLGLLPGDQAPTDEGVEQPLLVGTSRGVLGSVGHGGSASETDSGGLILLHETFYRTSSLLRAVGSASACVFFRGSVSIDETRTRSLAGASVLKGTPVAAAGREVGRRAIKRRGAS